MCNVLTLQGSSSGPWHAHARTLTHRSRKCGSIAHCCGFCERCVLVKCFFTFRVRGYGFGWETKACPHHRVGTRNARAVNPHGLESHILLQIEAPGKYECVSVTAISGHSFQEARKVYTYTHVQLVNGLTKLTDSDLQISEGLTLMAQRSSEE